MKRRNWYWMLAILLLCSSAHGEADIEAAEAAALQWLEAVDSGDYAGAWALSSALLREAIEPADLATALENSRRGFGSVLSRRRAGALRSTTLPGAPDGDYVVLTFQARFEHKQESIETITPRLEDGIWRVSGYYLR